MTRPMDERQVRRANRVIGGHMRDKDRTRRARRLAGAAPAARKPAKKARPESDEDWTEELEEHSDSEE